MTPACDFQRLTACYPPAPRRDPVRGGRAHGGTTGRQDHGEADVQGQDHGAYDHPSCVAPAADDYLLNDKIPMDGAGCS
ncbi:alpha/beta hydrolase [Streptomyces sp. NPDC001816]|uniref:alpha/beta hydrolase n=1 Tax=Streptomyces sp. NPDC001816 TaxID=3364612 RepID=UPI0036C400D2